MNFKVLISILIWLTLAQITLNQIQRIKKNKFQTKKISDLNRRFALKYHTESNKNNPFQDYLTSSSDLSWNKEQINNNIVNNWNSWQSNSWSTSDGWKPQNGWWVEDPWKDPIKKLSLVKITPEVHEVYAADVLIRENRFSNFGINGFVQFVQFENFVEVNGIICNLPPGKHAFHVHKFGEISGGCHETKGDFNPYSVNHGGPDYKTRHLGDLGNIEANSTGIAVFRFKDKQIKVHDKLRGIIGRSVVIHEFEDDFGQSNEKQSTRSGDSGGIIGCGVIGISQPSNYATLPMMCNKKN